MTSIKDFLTKEQAEKLQVINTITNNDYNRDVAEFSNAAQKLVKPELPYQNLTARQFKRILRQKKVRYQTVSGSNDLMIGSGGLEFSNLYLRFNSSPMDRSFGCVTIITLPLNNQSSVYEFYAENANELIAKMLKHTVISEFNPLKQYVLASQ